MALQRLGPQDDVNAVAVKQIVSLLRDKTLPFGQDLCLLRADTSYGKAIFLAPLYDQDDLVLLVRLRAGMKVWAKAPDADPTGGARRIFGDKFYLTDTSGWKTYRKKGVPYQVWQEALCEQQADEHLEKQAVLANHRKVILDIRRWNNLLIRTKEGASMKDKPLAALHSPPGNRTSKLPHLAKVPAQKQDRSRPTPSAADHRPSPTSSASAFLHF